MRKIREVLRLVASGLSHREVSRCSGMGKTTVRDCLTRARRAGMDWSQAQSLSDEELESRLYPAAVAVPASQRPAVDWTAVHQELRHKGVTLSLLWEEYREREPRGYRYSRYCELYRTWRGRADLTMRQVHPAGERLFVDYCGPTVPVIDPETGEAFQAQIFVAVWGASNYTYAEATRSQGLSDWIGSHVRAFEFSGGLPATVVIDNLRSGVTKTCRYEPELNATYQELAVHYGVAVLPARVRKPRDKAKVEVAVQVVERWILARLRHQTFFSLIELNQAIRELLVRLNDRPFRKLPGSRRTLFETLDRPALRPLPAERFVFAEWKTARVHIDYHVEVDGHFYSVPYALVGQSVEVRVSARTVECFAKRQRVASHVRSFRRGAHTTQLEHMPRPHREYAEWTPQRLVRWAAEAGPAVAGVVEKVMTLREHAERGYRSCLGILRLEQRFGRERLEAACQRALENEAVSYRSVLSILETGLDRQCEELPALRLGQHENLRGASYYSPQDGPTC